MKTIFIITSLLLCAIVAKLSFNTIAMYSSLSSKANDLWSRSFPLNAPRGIIYDVNSVVLASNQPTLTLYGIPYQIKDKEQAAKSLAPILNMSADDTYDKLTQRTSIISFSRNGRKLSYQEAEKIKKLNIPGLYLVQDNLRTYPYKEYLASLLGFVGIDNDGFAGLESYYDSYLKGKKGYLNYYMDAKGGLFKNATSSVVAPQMGMSLKLTIDIRLQNIIEREMQNAFYKYDAEEVMCIMMEPSTGKILAIGNRPTYDNNSYQDYDETIYNRLLPVFNSFEPGSTFKAMTFAAAVNEGVIDIDNDYYYDKGYEIVDGFTIKSWKKGGHGLQTFLEVLQNSSNPGFVEISRRLGKEKLYKYIYDFGFNQKTGVDIQGENKGLMFSYDNFNNLEMATTAFGQGISVSAIQLVTAFCSVINGGKLLKPFVVDSIINSTTNEIIYSTPVQLVRNVISEETSNTMRRALESVVALGSGRKAYIPNYRVGGKTGTAQIQKDGVYQDGNYILSFIAGAPMNDPQLVCYFNIKRPKNAIQYGGTTVGPIIKTILEESLNILNVEKNYEGIEKTYTWMDEELISIPNFIGYEKSQVKSKDLNLIFEGQGNYVIDQLPRVGEMVEKNSKVILMLGDKYDN